MATGPAPHILLCTDAAASAEDVQRLLEQAGCTVSRHLLGTADPEELPGCNLIVLEAVSGKEEMMRLCQRLRSRLADSFVPILFITADPAPSARLASLECGADTYLLRPFAAGEL